MSHIPVKGLNDTIDSLQKARRLTDLNWQIGGEGPQAVLRSYAKMPLLGHILSWIRYQFASSAKEKQHLSDFVSKLQNETKKVADKWIDQPEKATVEEIRCFLEETYKIKRAVQGWQEKFKAPVSFSDNYLQEKVAARYGDFMKNGSLATIFADLSQGKNSTGTLLENLKAFSTVVGKVQAAAKSDPRFAQVHLPMAGHETVQLQLSRKSCLDKISGVLQGAAFQSIADLIESLKTHLAEKTAQGQYAAFVSMPLWQAVKEIRGIPQFAALFPELDAQLLKAESLKSCLSSINKCLQSHATEHLVLHSIEDLVSAQNQLLDEITAEGEHLLISSDLYMNNLDNAAKEIEKIPHAEELFPDAFESFKIFRATTQKYYVDDFRMVDFQKMLEAMIAEIKRIDTEHERGDLINGLKNMKENVKVEYLNGMTVDKFLSEKQEALVLVLSHLRPSEIKQIQIDPKAVPAIAGTIPYMMREILKQAYFQHLLKTQAADVVWDDLQDVLPAFTKLIPQHFSRVKELIAIAPDAAPDYIKSHLLLEAFNDIHESMKLFATVVDYEKAIDLIAQMPLGKLKFKSIEALTKFLLLEEQIDFELCKKFIIAIPPTLEYAEIMYDLVAKLVAPYPALSFTVAKYIKEPEIRMKSLHCVAAHQMEINLDLAYKATKEMDDNELKPRLAAKLIAFGKKQTQKNLSLFTQLAPNSKEVGEALLNILEREKNLVEMPAVINLISQEMGVEDKLSSIWEKFKEADTEAAVAILLKISDFSRQKKALEAVLENLKKNKQAAKPAEDKENNGGLANLFRKLTDDKKKPDNDASKEVYALAENLSKSNLKLSLEAAKHIGERKLKKEAGSFLIKKCGSGDPQLLSEIAAMLKE